MTYRAKKGIVTVEVMVASPEKLLNLLWENGINASNVLKKSVITIRFDIDYRDYDKAKQIIKECRAKSNIVRKKGNVFFLIRLKNKKSLVIGAFIFVGILYYLSTYVWVIKIKTEDNVSPFEIRQDLKSLGITPGMKKSDIDVYKLESKLEAINNEILWLRIRIEGSTLKVIVQEKVNPPSIEKSTLGDSIAIMPGEIKRIFVTSGTALVSKGDFVKQGDILIKGTQGKEGEEYQVPAQGIVVANTFYERVMEVKIKGKTFKRTREKDTDIYIKLFGAKIYLKKAINNFKYYDKIVDNNTFLNKVIYFKKQEKEINIDKNKAIIKAEDLLETSLKKNLRNQAVISDKSVSIENIDREHIRVRVIFVVEQNIASTVTS